MARVSSRSSTRRRVTATLSAVARIGYAHWFFGNLYEAVVRVPDRLARDYTPDGDDRRLRSVFSPGSPVRYYVPAGQVTIAAAVAALAAGRGSPREQRWQAVSTVCAVSGAALTAHLVRNVNRTLFVAGHRISAAEQDALLRRWYRLNGVRLAAAGGAWLAAQRAAARRDAERRRPDDAALRQ